MSERIVLGLDFDGDLIGTLAISCRDGAKVDGRPRQHANRPDGKAVGHCERLYQRYLNWAARSGPMYAPGQEEA